MQEEEKTQPAVDVSGASFTPLVVVELGSSTREEAIQWLLSRIRDKQQSGGVEGNGVRLLPLRTHLTWFHPSACARC